MLIKIQEEKLLLVEGKHEVKFFNCLLEHMKIDDVQIEQVGGQYNFRPVISSLPKLDNFEIVRSIGLIRDADDNRDRVLQSIKDALINANLPCPDVPMESTDESPAIKIFIMPDNENPGALETLCVKSVGDEDSYGCVEQYFNCIHEIRDHPHPNEIKARVQVYLAKEDPGDLHMGNAAQKNIWDWDNPAFDQIKEFILLN